MARRLILNFFGPTGSGKDTLLKLVSKQLRDQAIYASRPVDRITISSIDAVKDFYLLARDLIDQPPLTELGQVDRQALSSIKTALDRSIDWTVNLAIRELERRGDVPNDVVLLYQAREVENVEKLRAVCVARGWGFLAVFVRRPGFDGAAGADSDRYPPGVILAANVVVVNDRLEDLPLWADHVARLVLTELNR